MSMIPFTVPALTGNEKLYVNEAIDTGWISGVGGFVSKFETALAEQVGVKHAIATANGTLSLEVLLMALGIGPGDEVVVPALTFASPAAAVRRSGAKPILADIDPVRWCVDPVSVERCLTHKTKAIIAVDLLGNPAPIPQLEQFGLPVIEDAAEAHGASLDGKPCGSMGLASSFSFHPNKGIVMGEGGAILTNWDWLAGAARKIANHGMDYPYHHDVVGTNARANNLTCAVGLAQVERWEDHLARRNQIRACYHDMLKDVVGLQPAWSSTWVVPIVHRRRGDILLALRRGGVDASPIFTPLCDLGIYQSGAVQRDYPWAREIGATALLLPTYERLSDDDLKRIVSIIKATVAA